MQVPMIDAATIVPVQTGGGVTVRVVAGNISQVPIGALLEATVTSVNPREVALSVNGLPLTVRPPTGLPPFRPGAVFVVRIPPGGANASGPALEFVGTPAPATPPGVPTAQSVPPTGTEPASVGRTATTIPDTAPTRIASQPVPGGAQVRLAVVDVLAPTADGRVRVSIDGTEQIATAATNEPLVTGERYVLQVNRAPNGIVLKTPPEGAASPTSIATALLRAPAPDLGATLKPLQAELAALAHPQPPKGRPSEALDTVRTAAATVSETLQTFVPREPRPPNALELQNLVENGGLHYEAKLARLVAEPETRPTSAEQGAIVERAPHTIAQTAGPDLKGDLLQLLHTVNDLGSAVRAPVAGAVLNGIESQQAAHVLAQANGTPYFLQVPFPDGGQWRTLRLSLEPQNSPDNPDAERAGRFRVFMHVPLTDLGETWIDAGVSGDKFRATIYLDKQTVLDRVKGAIQDLREELQKDGFSEVLLDVRSASDLPPARRRETGALNAGRPDTVSVLDVRA